MTTLTEQFIRDAVLIDPDAKVTYTHSNIGRCATCDVPAVGFTLIPTESLIRLADRFRYEKGFKPMKPVNGIADEVDPKVRYEFEAYLSKRPCKVCPNRNFDIDNCIIFLATNSTDRDNEELHEFTLNDTEQAILHELLEAQCLERLKKPCKEFLRESEVELSKYYENH